MDMKAAVLSGINDLSLKRVPVPEPAAGEVLLRIEANTICGTDLRYISGAKTAGVRPGVIMGHEFAGRIEAVGEGVEGVPLGAQATVSIVLNCNHCRPCQSGREHLCENLRLFGSAVDGGLAEYMLVPREAMDHGNLVVVPKELPPTLLALAEPVSCVLNGANQFRTQPGDTVVVLGTGPIGLLHIALARMAGATTIIGAGRPGRLEPALQMGATAAYDLTGDTLTQQIMKDTDGRGADVVVVAVGSLPLANQALQVASIGGRVNYFGGFPKGTMVETDPNLIHYKELVVTGGSNARRSDVVQAVNLLSSGRLDVAGVVTHTFGLDDLDAAVRAVEERQGLKVAVLPHG